MAQLSHHIIVHNVTQYDTAQRSTVSYSTVKLVDISRAPFTKTVQESEQR